ncbi:adenylate/guanylate cyclase domain-containing protein [Pseudoalteromonas sp. XMcav11-Q]|uniref:adenylate/guanylate cyclase domain-containing protein n=1 Tax=Pseudoalteromonas sp. XMcav11-Q TaxID=3136665 RepID=UPI0032C46D4F
MNKEQLPQHLIDIIDKQVDKFKKHIEIIEKDEIPLYTDDFPSEQSNKWIKVTDVICVYVDMKNSTQFSASSHANTTGKIYTLFTGTAVRVFKKLGAAYIDIKGDGVFALFNKNQVHTALAAAVTFKTFTTSVFIPKIQAKKADFDTGSHIGIHQGPILVSKIGLRKSKDHATDMFNEVWAGKTVNFTSKLASYSDNNDIIASPKFYNNIKCYQALYACECSDPVELWEEVDTSLEKKVPMDVVWRLQSEWCKKHGRDYLQTIVDADK